MKKLMTKLVCILVMSIMMLCIPGMSRALTIDSANFVDDIDYSTFDIRGRINGSDDNNFQTTFDYDGYEVYFKVGNDEELIYDYINGSVYALNGVELTITGTQSSDKKSVVVTYHVKNTTSESVDYAIATTADTELGPNDYAAMYKDGKSIVQITQDQEHDEYEDDAFVESYGAQVRIGFSPDATTSWIGEYSNRESNKYVNGSVTEYVCSDDVDTGLAYSWSGTLAAGGENTYKATFAFSKAETATVNFHKQGEATPYDTKTVFKGGAVVLPEITTGTNPKWNTAIDGSGTSYNPGSGFVARDSVIDLYEIIDATKYHIYFESNGGSEVETITALSNADLSEPEKPTKDGFVFKGWYLDENLTEEFKFDKMPAEDITVYAKWVIDYKIVEGEDQVYNNLENSSDLTIKTESVDSKFKEVIVNGEVVDPSNYVFDAENNTITLNAEYLKKLDVGTYSITIVYEAGEASTTFEIVANESKSVKAGDSFVIWMVLFTISIMGIAIVNKKNK